MTMVTISKKALLVSLFVLLFSVVLVGCKKLAPGQAVDTGAVVVDDSDELNDEDINDDEDGNDDENGEDEDGNDDENDTGDNDDDLVADVVIEVSGKNFEFSTDTIEVNEGDVVTINFVSESGFHDWVVDEFDAATEQVNPGTPTSVTFVADKAGTYEFYCSVGQHRAMGMTGNLIVN